MLGDNIKLLKLYADSSSFSEDILAFTETWLKPEISDSEVLSNNFSTYKTDRSPRGGADSRYPNEIEFVGVKVYFQPFSIFVSGSYIFHMDLT